MSTKSIVLGLHCGHDAGACLMIDGKVVADAQEERFTRQKHCSGIPYHSIWFCIKHAGIDTGDIDAVATSHPHLKLEHFFLFPGMDVPTPREAKTSIKQALGLSPKKSSPKPPDFVQVPGKVQGQFEIFSNGPLKAPEYLQQIETKASCKFFQFGHHECHAAGSYYTGSHASFEKSVLVFVFDGIGDDTSISVWKGHKGAMELLKTYGREFSLGFFYSTVTEVLSYQVLDGEGTTMGLAPYGQYSEAVADILESYLPKVVEQTPPDVPVGTVFRYDISGSPHFHLNRVNKLVKQLKGNSKEDIAFTAQALLEKEVLRICQHWMQVEGIEQVYLSGGVALNVKMNSVLAEKGIKSLEVFPNPGDGGLPFGNALLASKALGHIPTPQLTSLYWGYSSNEDEIEYYLKSRGIRYSKPDNVFEAAASLLSENKAIGWYQGAMESGPRALGNRSILMSPSKAAHKDYLNEHVKYRQGFRPFCPSLLEGHEHELLEGYDGKGKFMIRAYRVSEKGKDVMPAAVHVDGTTRPQVVGHENERFKKLLEAFYSKTGIPVLINTSLNVKGEPIACTHVDALKCFYTSGLHALVLGNFIVYK